MIEWAMLGALGALAASLLWLLALPALSRRTTRLATTRLVRQMPMTPAAIAAERDQLRAAHAVAVRQLEQARDAAVARNATLQSETGRHLARTVVLEREAVELRAEIVRLERELQAMTLALMEAQGVIGAQTVALHEAVELAGRRWDQLAATAARLGAEEVVTSEQRATIAALETRSTGQDLRLGAALAQAARAEENEAAIRADRDRAVAARAEAMVELARHHAVQAEVDRLTAEVVRLRAGLEEADRTSALAEKSARLQGETVAGLTDRVLAQDHELRLLHRLAVESRTRRQALDAPEEAPAGVDPVAREADRLRAAVAALGADLVAFATREATAGEDGAPGPGPSG